MMLSLCRESMHPPLFGESDRGHHGHMNLCPRQNRPILLQGLLHDKYAGAVVYKGLTMVDKV